MHLDRNGLTISAFIHIIPQLNEQWLFCVSPMVSLQCQGDITGTDINSLMSETGIILGCIHNVWQRGAGGILFC